MIINHDYVIYDDIIVNVINKDYVIVKTYIFTNKTSNKKSKGFDNKNILGGENKKNVNNIDDIDNIDVVDDDFLFNENDIKNMNNLNVLNIEFKDNAPIVISAEIIDSKSKDIYIDDMIFFNYETLISFKKKIGYILKVNYKFISILNNDVIKIFINNLKYINKNLKELLNDVPIDYNMYQNKSNLNIEIYDSNIYLKDIDLKDINIFVLSDLITLKKQLLSIINSDIELFNIIYISFIFKYFPELTKDEFYRWLNDNDDLNYNYNINYMREERRLYNTLIKHDVKDVNNYINSSYKIINNLIKIKINVLEDNSKSSNILNAKNINTRYVFNNLEIAKYENLTCIVFKDQTYNIVKFNKFIKFDEKILKKNELKTSLEDLILYFEDYILIIKKKGILDIFITYKCQVKDVFKFCQNVINKTLSLLNLPEINKTNYKIYDHNYSYILQDNINADNFNHILTLLIPLFHGDIIDENNDDLIINQKKIELKKLICNDKPDILLFDGIIDFYNKFRTIIFEFRDQKLYINFTNINEKEYNIINSFFYKFLYHIHKNIFKQELVDYKKVNLRNMDPITFDNTYSRSCQKKYQPVAIKKEDISKYKESTYVRIKNRFTDNYNYYHCPNKQFPYIKFLKGVKNNFCLPCCKQKDNTQFEQYKKIHENCINTNEFLNEDEINTGYIINYTNNIMDDKIMKLPVSLNFLNLSEDLYYVKSTKKLFNSYNVSIIHILCDILNIEFDMFILDIIKKLKKNTYIFYTLLKGDILKYFSTIDEFITAISDLFIYNDSINTFIDWNQIFIEFGIFYNIKFIIINYTPSSLNMDYNNMDDNAYKAFVINDDKYYNLIFDINTNTKIFKNNDIITKSFSKIIETFNIEYNTFYNLNYIDYSSLKEYSLFKKYEITYCINQKVNCYGIILNNIYIPINDQYNLSLLDMHKTKESSKLTNISNLKLESFENIINFISDYNKFIYKSSNYLNDIIKTYLNNIKNINKNNLIFLPDFNFLGNYIRIKSFLIFNNNIVGINVNDQVMYCRETSVDKIKKFICNEYEKLNKNLSNFEILVTRNISILKELTNCFYNNYNVDCLSNNYLHKILYHPLEISILLEKENKNYKLDDYLNNLYEKNLYKLFVNQIVNYYNKQISSTNVLKKIKKYKLDKFNLLPSDIKTKIDLIKFLEKDVILKKIQKKSELFIIKQKVDFKYNDTLFIQSCNNNGIFCEKNKLVMTRDDYDKLCILFVNDIKNPYRQNYITNFDYYDNLNSIYNYHLFVNEMIILN